MLKKIALGVGLVLLAAVAGGFALPRHVHVERRIVIDAPEELVFDLLNTFEGFDEWSPWAERDPDMTVTLAGPVSGVGASMSWKSEEKDIGSGSQTITVSEPPQYIKIKLQLPGQRDSESFFNLARVDKGTEVVWGFETDLGFNPFCHYMGLVMDRWVGRDFTRGLEKLKDVAENED